MNLRLFIAIDIPERIKREVGDVIGIFKKYETDVKWIEPENFHLTLKFLGSTAESLAERIRDALLPVVSAHKPFPLHLRSTGIFPNEKYPRVIWIGIVDSDPLKTLRNDIERTLTLLGFEGEEKHYHPHLTLGRVRDRKGTISLMNEVKRLHDKDFGEFQVDTVNLMKSELRPKGAQYTCLYPMPLAGSGCSTIHN